MIQNKGGMGMGCSLHNKLDVNIEVALKILIETTLEYMKAFEFTESSMKIIESVLSKYKAFEKVTAYYMDADNKCISFVNICFDWDNYSIKTVESDAEIVNKRKTIISQTPRKILEEACKVIKQRVKSIKDERGFAQTWVVFTYTRQGSQDQDAMNYIKENTNLTPFDSNSIVYSEKMRGTVTEIIPSITESSLIIKYHV